MEAMDGFPVVIRLLDPPLHEFVPREEAKLEAAGQGLSVSHGRAVPSAPTGCMRSNPMMGHRGVRLGITYPEVSEMQITGDLRIRRRAAQGRQKAVSGDHDPGHLRRERTEGPEGDRQTGLRRGPEEVRHQARSTHMFGTMIEIPRAALMADQIAEVAEFFCFGTNDLTQMTFGFSRDDIGGFMPEYVSKKDSAGDPFQTHRPGRRRRADQDRHRARPQDEEGTEVGICGEHGGDPDGGILPRGRYGLCQLLTVPRADRPAGGRSGGGRQVNRRQPRRLQ